MSTTLTVHLKCAGCDKFLNKVKGKKKMIHNENEANAFARLFQRNIIVNDILCNKCRLSIYSKSKKNSKSEIERDLSPFELTSDDPTYEVQFKSKKSISESNTLKCTFRELLLLINIVVFVLPQKI